MKSAVPSIGRLNARSDQITLHAGPPGLGIFEGPKGALDEYFQHPNQPELNSPILRVHVEVLSDATFLSVQIPHLVTDARGFETILRSWATVMNNSLDEAPSPTPLGWNPLHGLGDSSKPANNSELIPSGWSCLVGDSVTKLMEATLKEFEEEPVTKNISLHIPSSEIRRHGLRPAPHHHRLLCTYHFRSFCGRNYLSDSLFIPGYTFIMVYCQFHC